MIFFFFADYWFTGRFEHHALMRRGVMERQRSFVFSMVFLMPHSHGIKNNEWSVKCVSLEITLSLSLLGKLFVVVDERECKDFSRVLHDHYLQNNLLIKGELADKNSNGAENKSLNIPSSGAWKADFQTYFYFFILFFLSSPPPPCNYWLLFPLLMAEPAWESNTAETYTLNSLLCYEMETSVEWLELVVQNSGNSVVNQMYPGWHFLIGIPA